MPPRFQGFSPECVTFLKDLESNNERDWFNAHKQVYESMVQRPALAFIEDFGSQLQRFSPYFVADARKVGGSLMRIYRDTRFSKEKTPYKTNVGIQFRHETGKDVHAPGLYVHIDPRERFLGVGLWHPEPEALRQVRERIAAAPEAWRAARGALLDAGFHLTGDSNKKVPAPWTADHPEAEDLKRKDFIGLLAYDEGLLYSANFSAWVGDRFLATRPFMAFLCDAMGVSI